MQKYLIVLTVALCLSSCAPEKSVNIPGITISDLSFSSLEWEVKNIPVSDHYEGFSYSPWAGRSEYNRTDTVMEQLSGTGTRVSGHDPHYTFEVDRNDLDSAKIDIDQQRKVLSMIFSCSTWHPSMSDKPSSGSGYLVRLIDLPYEMESDSSIIATVSGQAASTHVIFSSHAEQSTGGTGGYPHSSSNARVSGPVVKVGVDASNMVVALHLRK